MKVLACGGREYADRERVFAKLDELHAALGITLLIDGAAPGADAIAHEWAIARGIPTRRFPAHWRHSEDCPRDCRETIGRSAGHVRNRRMIAQGCPDYVVAFPGTHGTWNMVQQAQAAYLTVEIVP